MENDNLEIPSGLEEPTPIVTPSTNVYGVPSLTGAFGYGSLQTDSITIEETISSLTQSTIVSDVPSIFATLTPDASGYVSSPDTLGLIDDNIQTPNIEFIPPSHNTYSFLVYDDTIDTSTIQNVLFINSVVNDFQQYANANTFPIVFSRENTREQMLELLSNKFQNISRIALVCHFSEEPYFLNNETLSSDTNTQFIIDLVKQFNVLHMDYLACNTLQNQVWTDYYTKVYDATGILIGASDDNTGNLKYGGDWVLESTQEDVQTIYFNDLIQNYASLLISFTYLSINYTTTGLNASVSGHSNAQVLALNGIVNIPMTVYDLSGSPYTVTSIAPAAFQDCTNLTFITLPGSVTSIEIYAFRATHITSINLPTGLNYIGHGAFKSSWLKSITIPGSVTTILDDTFTSCTSLSVVNLQYGIATISTTPNYPCFDGCTSLKSIIIPNSVTTVAGGAFKGCTNLNLIVLSDNITTINEGTFLGCGNFSSIVIPAKVTGFGNNIFGGALKTVAFLGTTIPSLGTVSNFTNVADTAIYMPGTDATNIAKLTSHFTYRITQTTTAFSYNGINYTTLYCNATVASYQSTSLTGIITLPSTITDASGTLYTVTTIAENAFKNCINI